ncbi:nup54 domain-containing protein [Vairimorpha necatrix]|uniref:Nup54 domain-containing protein n=1 Tax=Vairimorpha necatrix TaxID=6039 RepID=A0AAX4JCE3_9MICR
MFSNLEMAYNPESPNYKFKFVFYNKVSSPFLKPVDFPDDLWFNALKKDNTLMPVLLKGKEIELRRKNQLDTLSNLNMSYSFLQSRIDELKLKSERIRSKLQNSLINEYLYEHERKICIFQTINKI